jgi:hypothetical protein
MKKVFIFIAIFSVVITLIAPAHVNAAGSALVVNLMAGQNEFAGTVKVWDEGDSLYVLYETIEPWCMTETHLAVASSLEGIPQSNGNPVPGNFPYKNTHKCATSFLYTVPLSSGACELYIAAHAVVKKPGSNETAWGNGVDFPGSNWATYFIYEISDCNITPAPTETETSTPKPPTSTETPTSTPPTDTPTPPPPTETPTTTPTSTVTPTITPTSTITPTETPTVCEPVVVVADFSQVAVGASVEGLGVVAPGLNIDAKGTAVSLRELVSPVAYGAGDGNSISNGGMAANGGFSDIVTKSALQPHLYTFTFAPGTSVSNFSLHMLDFGDWNPSLSTSHYVSMTAYNAGGFVVAEQEISYTTPATNLPSSSSIYGDLRLTGDALSATPGQPGNWTWNLSGNGIVRVVLEFGVGHDPAIAFDTLTFTTECNQVCQIPASIADFSQVAVGASVEGLGVVAPGLNIDAKGTAVSLRELVSPVAYGAGDGNSISNGGMAANGGFSDIVTKSALQPHLYTFTFAPGTSVSNFSLHMLDFGDWNPSLSTSHYVSMTAYNAGGFVVAEQEISYTTPATNLPSSSSIYGDLRLTGDALSATPGQPGNWTWNLSGNGIVRVVLEFGVGHDPAIAFDTLTFTPDCP